MNSKARAFNEAHEAVHRAADDSKEMKSKTNLKEKLAAKAQAVHDAQLKVRLLDSAELVSKKQESPQKSPSEKMALRAAAIKARSPLRARLAERESRMDDSVLELEHHMNHLDDVIQEQLTGAKASIHATEQAIIQVANSKEPGHWDKEDDERRKKSLLLQRVCLLETACRLQSRQKQKRRQLKALPLCEIECNSRHPTTTLHKTRMPSVMLRPRKSAQSLRRSRKKEVRPARL